MFLLLGTAQLRRGSYQGDATRSASDQRSRRGQHWPALEMLLLLVGAGRYMPPFAAAGPARGGWPPIGWAVHASVCRVVAPPGVVRGRRSRVLAPQTLDLRIPASESSIVGRGTDRTISAPDMAGRAAGCEAASGLERGDCKLPGGWLLHLVVAPA